MGLGKLISDAAGNAIDKASLRRERAAAIDEYVREHIDEIIEGTSFGMGHSVSSTEVYGVYVDEDELAEIVHKRNSYMNTPYVSTSKGDVLVQYQLGAFVFTFEGDQQENEDEEEDYGISDELKEQYKQLQELCEGLKQNYQKQMEIISKAPMPSADKFIEDYQYVLEKIENEKDKIIFPQLLHAVEKFGMSEDEFDFFINNLNEDSYCYNPCSEWKRREKKMKKYALEHYMDNEHIRVLFADEYAEKEARAKKKREAEEAKRKKKAEEQAQREKEEALEKEVRKTSLPLNLIKWGLSILLLFIVDGFFMSIMASGLAFTVMNFCFKPIINKKRKELGLEEE